MRDSIWGDFAEENGSIFAAGVHNMKNKNTKEKDQE